MRRERRLVLALVAALALLVIAVAVTVGHDRRALESALPPATDGVSRVAITRVGRADIVLERQGEGWRITAPCALEANASRVAPLLAALGAGGTGYAAGDVDLEAAGLQRPAAVVRLDGEALRLGGTDLSGERRYVQRGGRVTLVPEWVLSLVDGGLSALAEPALFDAPPVGLRRLPPTDTATGTRTRDDAGSDAGNDVGTGADTPLDIAPWAALMAYRIVEWPLRDAPPTTRRARLEAVLASGETRRLQIESNARWSAIRLGNGACAHIVDNADLPANAYP